MSLLKHYYKYLGHWLESEKHSQFVFGVSPTVFPGLCPKTGAVACMISFCLVLLLSFLWTTCEDMRILRCAIKCVTMYWIVC